LRTGKFTVECPCPEAFRRYWPSLSGAKLWKTYGYCGISKDGDHEVHLASVAWLCGTTAEMRGIGRCREGTCGVAGYLVEGKQKKFRGLHYCGSPRMCLSRNLFVCDTSALFTRLLTFDQLDQDNFSTVHFIESRLDVILKMRSSRVSCGGKTWRLRKGGDKCCGGRRK
jgi:hypothetical protein